MQRSTDSQSVTTMRPISWFVPIRKHTSATVQAVLVFNLKLPYAQVLRVCAASTHLLEHVSVLHACTGGFASFAKVVMGSNTLPVAPLSLALH
jgi:hypothetical protein